MPSTAESQQQKGHPDEEDEKQPWLLDLVDGWWLDRNRRRRLIAAQFQRVRKRPRFAGAFVLGRLECASAAR